MARRRLWVCTNLAGSSEREVPSRSTTPADDAAIATLLAAAYLGTVDHQPEHAFDRELQIWRSVDHADDQASRLAFQGDDPVSVCLIGREFDLPLLYEIATDPAVKQNGVGRAVLMESMKALKATDETALLAWVTEGNAACERLLSSVGFVAATRGLSAPDARALYAEIATFDPVDLPKWLLGRPS